MWAIWFTRRHKRQDTFALVFTIEQMVAVFGEKYEYEIA